MYIQKKLYLVYWCGDENKIDTIHWDTWDICIRMGYEAQVFVCVSIRASTRGWKRMQGKIIPGLLKQAKGRGLDQFRAAKCHDQIWLSQRMSCCSSSNHYLQLGIFFSFLVVATNLNYSWNCISNLTFHIAPILTISIFSHQFLFFLTFNHTYICIDIQHCVHLLYPW